MSKNLQKMMASKYPSQPTIMRESPTPSTESSSRSSTDKHCILSPKKMLMVAILLGVLFFILSHPQTFKLVGSFFPTFNNGGSAIDHKLVALHALIFALIVFVLFRMMC